MITRLFFSLQIAVASLVVGNSAVAQTGSHGGHINAGIIDTAPAGAGPGDQLAFYSEEIPNFESGQGFAVRMNFNSGAERYRGYYSGGQTFTAFSALGTSRDPRHPALNSYIQLRIVSVAGPAGGVFDFWESTDYDGGNAPTYSVNVDAPQPTPLWRLTEDKDENGDPGGHIHGRRFSANFPGTYTVGFQLFDTSTANNGARFHEPSEVYLIDFIAIPEPASGVLLGAGGLAALALRRRRS